MDSRGSNNNSSSNSSSNTSSSSNSSSNHRSSKDQGGRVSPSDYYYGSGAGSGLGGSHDQGLYTTNNNDYSKYSSGHSPSSESEYGTYANGPKCDYPSSPYDVNNCREDYSSDNRHSVPGDYSQCQSGYSSRCYGSCSPSGYSECDPYGACHQPECAPATVQVTAKVLFGSVSAISNLKQKKSTKK